MGSDPFTKFLRGQCLQPGTALKAGGWLYYVLLKWFMP